MYYKKINQTYSVFKRCIILAVSPSGVALICSTYYTRHRSTSTGTVSFVMLMPARKLPTI